MPTDYKSLLLILEQLKANILVLDENYQTVFTNSDPAKISGFQEILLNYHGSFPYKETFMLEGKEINVSINSLHRDGVLKGYTISWSELSEVAQLQKMGDIGLVLKNLAGEISELALLLNGELN